MLTKLEVRLLRLAARNAAAGTKEAFINAMVLINELSYGNTEIGSFLFEEFDEGKKQCIKPQNVGRCEIDDFGNRLVSGSDSRHWVVSDGRAAEYCDRLVKLISYLLAHNLE